MSRSPEARRRADDFGRRGEAFAARWLAERGWEVVARRVRTKAGEIDLIAKRPGLIAFVEVKTRASAVELDLAIDAARLARVAAAAELLLADYATGGEDARIDVLLIAPGAVRHIENAWLG